MLLASAFLFLRAPTGGLAAHSKAAQLPVLLNKPPPSAEASRNALKDMLPVIEKLRHIGGTAGVSIGVLNHGEVVDEFSLGFSDRDSQRIADLSTRYPLGSLSKAFVATTVSELVHEGLLEWDKPVTAYLPELHFAADPSLADGLTLVDLLYHQTDLERLDTFWLGAENEVLVAKDLTVAAINQLSPVSPLRTKWMYNNWMYALVGEVMERVTRSSRGTALQTWVLEPLQLQQTTVIKSRIPAGSTASPYMITDDGDPVRIADVPLLDGTTMSPAGGVRSSAHDMLIWAKALMAGFRGETSPLHRVEDVLSGHAFTNRSSGFDELYALGLAKVTTPTQFGKMGFNPGLVDQMPLLGADGPPTSIFYHNGAMPGYNHCLMMIPGQQDSHHCAHKLHLPRRHGRLDRPGHPPGAAGQRQRQRQPARGSGAHRRGRCRAMEDEICRHGGHAGEGARPGHQGAPAFRRGRLVPAQDGGAVAGRVRGRRRLEVPGQRAGEPDAHAAALPLRHVLLPAVGRREDPPRHVSLYGPGVSAAL